MIKRLAEDLRLRPQVALLSPNQLLLRPYFWTHQLWFLAIVAISVLALWYLAPYTYTATGNFEYFTMAVQLIALWGAVMTLTALANIDLEMSILGEIENNGSQYLERIKSNQILRVDLNLLEEETLPNNLHQPAPAMIRLFRHICKEAKDRRFESSINVVQPYRDEPLEDVFKLQNLQKIALWLGILGTFVGLLLVVNNSDLNGANSNEAFAALIKKMFDGLVVSFSASLAGLQVAVVLGLFLLLLRKRQEVYFKMMENAALTMLSVARHTIVRDDFLNEFAQISTSVDLLGSRVYEQTQELSAKLKAVHDRVDTQTTSIEHGMKGLTKVKADFENSLAEVSKAQKVFLEDVKKIYTAIALKDLSTALETGIKQAGKQISDTLDPNVRSISKELGEFSKVLQSLNRVVANQSSGVADSAKRIETRVSDLAAANERTVRDLGRQMQEGLTRSEANIGVAIKSDLQQLGIATSRLTNAVQQARFTTSSPYAGGGAPSQRRGREGIFASLRDWYNSRF